MYICISVIKSSGNVSYISHFYAVILTSRFCSVTSDAHQFMCLLMSLGVCGSSVVKVLRYKLEGRWFNPRWCHGIFP
jgi:hypothetical protein